MRITKFRLILDNYPDLAIPPGPHLLSQIREYPQQRRMAAAPALQRLEHAGINPHLIRMASLPVHADQRFENGAVGGVAA